MRNASNGNEVAALIGARCGEAVRILTGEDEARLMYQAVIGGLGRPVRDNSCVVFDLGGGSTEVVSGVGERPGRWTSLPFGAVSLTEKHLHSNPPSPVEIEALNRDVSNVLMHECAHMPDRAPVLAGVGGTITVLAMLDRRLKSYDPARLEGWGIPAERLEALTARICATTQEERRNWPAMGEGRADIVVAGVLVVAALARRFPSPVLVCSTQGLRYGLVRMAADLGEPGSAA
jgi:exopolyphosphatase/guanosine-5'-triphosphate,3'-diphosphate pyrophosphatase